MQSQTKRVLLASLPHSYFTHPLKKSFEKIGYQVKVFNFQKPTLMSRLYGFTRATNAYAGEISAALIGTAKSFKPDIFLAIKGDTITPTTVHKLNHLGITTINWFPDWLISWPWLKKNTSSYQYFFVSCLATYKKLNQHFPNIHYIPFAADVDVPRHHNPKIYPISFIGQHSPRREKYFREIADLGLHIWGYSSWKTSSLSHLYHNQLSISDTKKVLRQSHMTVNILTGDDVFQPHAVNVRSYESTGVGTCLLVHHTSLIKQYFKPQKEVVTFKNPHQLRQKVLDLLSHPQKLQTIATAGYHRAKKDHSLDIRLQELLNVVK